MQERTSARKNAFVGMCKESLYGSTLFTYYSIKTTIIIATHLQCLLLVFIGTCYTIGPQDGKAHMERASNLKKCLMRVKNSSNQFSIW